MKKALSLVLSITAMAGLLGGCSTTTKTPEIEMTLEYQGEKYVLEYTLYRDVAPSTVEHFMKLVENDYYNGLCIHDYKQSDKMYAGGYSYVDGELVYREYYETVKTYKDFPYSVWQDYEKSKPLYTLRGEFENNGYKVKDNANSGALKESFGSLSMYYTAKNTDAQVYEYNRSKDKMQIKGYEANSATSLFTIAMKDFGSVNTDYCTFATLNDDSVNVLENLLENIEEDSDYTKDVEVTVDRDDIYEKDFYNKVSYAVLKSALVIKDMKIIKY